MEDRKQLYYDRSRLLGLIVELREARDELSTEGMRDHARILSLAITDLESADNWLQRVLAIPV